MPQFRISLGSANCKKIEKKNSRDYEICELVKSKLDSLSATDYSKLDKLSNELTIEYFIQNKKVMLSTYKKEIDNFSLLIVVQAAYKSLYFPNYISLRFIGKIFVDGVIVYKNGSLAAPDDDLLLEFK